MIRKRRQMVCLFILAASASLVFFVVNRPRVLIIQSVSAESNRSKLFKDGWARSLEEKHLLAKLSWYSLEQDRYPQSEARTAGAFQAISRERPDLVVLVDDAANERVGRSLAAEGKTPLLFVGIDQTPNNYGYGGNAHISGIVEHIRLEPFHELLSILYPGMSLKYGVIGVDNPSGRARLEQIHNCTWSQHILSDSILVRDFSEWKEFINRHQDFDVLLILNVDSLDNHIGEQGTISVREVVNWTEVNSKPLPMGVEADYVANGGGLAFEFSPRRFGELASSRTKDWLNIKNAPPLDYLHAKDFQVSMCRSRLAVRDIEIPEIYEESAFLSGTLYP